MVNVEDSRKNISTSYTDDWCNDSWDDRWDNKGD